MQDWFIDQWQRRMYGMLWINACMAEWQTMETAGGLVLVRHDIQDSWTYVKAL